MMNQNQKMKKMMRPASLQRSIQQKHLQLQTIPLYWMKSKKICTLSRKERSFEALLVLHCDTASVHASDWLELSAIYVSNNKQTQVCISFPPFPAVQMNLFCVRQRKLAHFGNAPVSKKQNVYLQLPTTLACFVLLFIFPLLHCFVSVLQNSPVKRCVF